MSIYVIDFNKKGFLYVSDNPLFLCGMSAEQVREMGLTSTVLNFLPKIYRYSWRSMQLYISLPEVSLQTESWDAH